MKITRTLYALAAIALGPPAVAADVSYRDASNEKIAAISSEPAVSDHPCEAWADRDGKPHCRCTLKESEKMDKGTRAPEPHQVEFTDRG